MVEIIVYNILFWGSLVAVTKIIENVVQVTIDNFDQLQKNKKGK
jgi:hypothetical protein